jgi:hypothetical protein
VPVCGTGINGGQAAQQALGNANRARNAATASSQAARRQAGAGMGLHYAVLMHFPAGRGGASSPSTQQPFPARFNHQPPATTTATHPLAPAVPVHSSRPQVASQVATLTVLGDQHDAVGLQAGALQAQQGRAGRWGRWAGNHRSMRVWLMGGLLPSLDAHPSQYPPTRPPTRKKTMLGSRQARRMAISRLKSS